MIPKCVFYLIYIINPLVERLLVSASGLSTKITHCSTKISGLSTKITHCSTKISGLSMKITHCSTKISGLSTKITHCSMKITHCSMKISGLSTKISGLSMSAVRLCPLGRISNPTSALLIRPPRKNPRFHRDFSAVNIYIVKKGKHPAHLAHLARKLTVCSIYLARS